jgi:hypothetical protein
MSSDSSSSKATLSWCAEEVYSENSNEAKAYINVTFYDINNEIKPYSDESFQIALTDVVYTDLSPSFCVGSTPHQYSADVPVTSTAYTPITATVNMVDECQTGFTASSEIAYTPEMAPMWFTSNVPETQVAIVPTFGSAGNSITLTWAEPLKNCNCDITDYSIFMKIGDNAMQETSTKTGISTLSAVIEDLDLS